jgi:two-component system, OmpR family, phosphate regulon sensor histidine kinase PhoR
MILISRYFSPLSFLIVAIMVAALTLGYYSYHTGRRIAAKREESVETSNRVVGLKLIDRLEKVIIDSDKILFQMVRLDDPREFVELWRRIVRESPLVDTVVVLNEHCEVVHFFSKQTKADLKSFRKLFMQRILPDMKLDSLPPYTHKHLHTLYNEAPHLISFIKQRSLGEDYFVALNMNLPYITSEIFNEEFGELVSSKYIAVLDDRGKIIYGTPADTYDPFVFEERFPTTLYLWRLQITPREVKVLRQDARAQGRYNLVLVIIAVSIILIGILVLLIAVRKERKANRLKSEFISNVTHELKTPLSLIRMFGELLALGRASGRETTREYAEIIIRESDRLTRLIDNVLDFARIERGKAAYQFTMGNLATVVERGVDLCHYRAEQIGAVIKTEIETGLPETLLDENAMTLLLLNLIENALKYGSEGGGEIAVILRKQGGRLVLTVADHGPGIPKEEQTLIFERFYRAKAVRSKPTRGSGIGLSLVKHIAEAHGGQVRVESELGKGALFEVFIPLREESS